MLDFRVDLSDLRGLGQQLHANVVSGLHRAVRVASESAQRRAQANAPVKDGDLQKSLMASPVKSLVNVVWSTVTSRLEYLRWVVEGTRAHRIEARRAKALHWTSGGQKFFRGAVNHPGTKPNPFLLPAASVADTTLAAATDRAVDDAISRTTR